MPVQQLMFATANTFDAVQQGRDECGDVLHVLLILRQQAFSRLGFIKTFGGVYNRVRWHLFDPNPRRVLC